MAERKVRNIVTIGASAGGISAVSKLLSSFYPNLNAAVFVVIHISKDSLTDIILHELQKNTKLKCTIPLDGEDIQNNTIYLAPADHQMMLKDEKIRVRKGAFENHWRPSIDVLFRSAAAAYDSCVTGIILTGLMDDGTSGMSAIKRSGGVCMVQDPEESDFSDMPNNVLNNVDVDYKVTVTEMGYILSDLFSRDTCEKGEVPKDVQQEAEITLRMGSNQGDTLNLGTPSSLTCPACGGILTKIEQDKVTRYRCYTGHSFTENILEQEQINALEDSLWVAIRMMEERRNLLSTMTNYNSATKLERAEQMTIHIARLKKVMMEIGQSKDSPEFHS